MTRAVSAEPVFWVDGQPASSLPLPDRGLLYGDGLFETLLVADQRPLLLDLHLQRLADGLARLGFPDCLSLAGEQLQMACRAAGPGFQVLRLTITRGAGLRGYAPPEASTARIIIQSQALDRDPRQPLPPARLAFLQTRWGMQPQLAGIKHLNRLEQVLAAGEARDSQCDDGVMLGQGGEVVSTTSGNLFAIAGGRLLTPTLDQAGIAGTRRRLVLEELAPACGLQGEVGTLNRDDLLTADELFLCNAVNGLRAVASLEARQWPAQPITARLQRAYAAYLS